MRELRVAFTDFWSGFDPGDNAFVRAFAASARVRVVSFDEADLLVYGNFGRRHSRFVGTKVAYSGECVPPDWAAADFAIGYELIDHPRYLRLPLFALIAMDDERAGFPGALTPWHERKRFCSFLQSVPGDSIRRQMVAALSEYRRVDCAGAFLNNVAEPGLAGRRDGDWRNSKVEYQQQFRFVVAFENRSHPGYTTEKLYDALVSGAIPLYWGNPCVDRDFDPTAFIWCRGPDDLSRVVDKVMVIDSDDSVAERYLEASRVPLVAPREYTRRLQAFLAAVAQNALRGAPPGAKMRALRLRTASGADRALRRVKSYGRGFTGRR